MYKNFLFKTAFFTVVMVLLATIFCSAGFAYTDTKNIVFVDGTFVATGNEQGTRGKSAEYPFTNIGEAYKSLYGTGGTVVVCGKTKTQDFSTNSQIKHTSPVYFTSTFEGVDYAKSNDARIVMYRAVHFQGDVVFENITFSSKNFCYIHGSGNRLVFGEGVNVLKGTAADENYTNSSGEYVASERYLDIRGGGEGVAYNRDLYLEFNSGIFSGINAGTKKGNVDGDVNVVINTDTISKVNLGNDRATAADGTSIMSEYTGDVNVTVNSGELVSFSLDYVNHVGGSINIALNNGSSYATTFKLTPDKGLYIVKAGEHGKVENLGGGYFKAVADEGYIAMAPAGATDVSAAECFAPELQFKVTERETTVQFVDRANKPAPLGIYTYPAADMNKADGELRGTNISMEYRLQGSEEFTAITSGTVKGLRAGTYEVRYKAENGYPAGKIAVYTVSGRGADVVVSDALAAREAKIKEVRSATSSLNPSDYNNVYYVSASGSDNAAGNSEQAPFKTVKKANEKAKSGDLVLLKRGDIFREKVYLVSGVDYSSYGDASLQMPFIYGSYENAADPEKWELVDGTENIWLYKNRLTYNTATGEYEDKGIPDVGVVVFNDGEYNSVKEIPDYYNGTYFVRGSSATEVFDLKKHLDNDLEHFSEHIGVQKSEYEPRTDYTKLYLRCEKGNPGDVFESIEINTVGHVVNNSSNCHFDNIGIKYGGAHGIGGTGAKDFTVTNCEIAWIGGGAPSYERKTTGPQGSANRYGNGIEIWMTCDGYTIKNCYIYQCYDAGITNQGRGADTKTGALHDIYMNDVYFCDNLLEYNVYNIEYFLSHVRDEQEYINANKPVPLMTNINYIGNLCFYAGYGFGMQRPDPGRMTHIKTWKHENPAVDFRIEDNILFDAIDYPVYIQAIKDEYLPKFSGNTYIQKRGVGSLAYGTYEALSVMTYENGIKGFISSMLGEENATVVFLETVSDNIKAVTDERKNKLYVTGLDGYTSVSFDGGESWTTPETESVEFSLDILESDEVMVRAVSRGNDSNAFESKSIKAEPAFSVDPAAGDTVTSCNLPVSDNTVFFPTWAKKASDDLTFDDTLSTAYVSHDATDLAEHLSTAGIQVKYYGDTNSDGKVSFDDYRMLIMYFAAGANITDINAADISFDADVSLLDLASLLKIFK